MAQDSGSETALYERLRAVIEEKKSLRNPLIEVLRAAQEIFGYLPMEVQEFIAAEMNIPVNTIYGVVTFYNFFTMKPHGKYTINVCLGTACYVKGASRVVSDLEEALGIKMGETTPDRLFTLSAVRCVGACSLAPVCVIGEDTYGRLESKKQIQEILKRYN
ncbi:MAG TPA: NAD(P)H-dependent oxidoreductase subunit E [Candidatus Cloacimonadota bacterium]|nr:NAD(P)H-dependent oxidoreductase subunit E [Candidatus Cloacimonadota bacterium]HQL14546.1 NAD(P)H-dependent oxidoreductase subunit E [Candidatus Cloacimonadota bacterium]